MNWQCCFEAALRGLARGLSPRFFLSIELVSSRFFLSKSPSYLSLSVCVCVRISLLLIVGPPVLVTFSFHPYCHLIMADAVPPVYC